MLKTLFLRIFAANLSRGWRNNPDTAWSDTIYIVELLVTLPLLTFCIFVWVILMDVWPHTVGALGWSDAIAVILFTVSWLIVHVPLVGLSRRYRDASLVRRSGESSKDFRY